jgi:hypothetical protein
MQVINSPVRRDGPRQDAADPGASQGDGVPRHRRAGCVLVQRRGAVQTVMVRFDHRTLLHLLGDIKLPLAASR